MTQTLLQKIKEANQDFEWYPTTNEIIDCIAKHMKEQRSEFKRILDIGAGNGKLFERLNNVHELGMKCYAIEKSEILIQELPPYVFVIGTDFENQTLIDKSMNIIFSNPPYKQFEEWSCKIIQEAYTEEIYLVIPARWEKSKNILNELEKRECEYKILESFDFLESEDRKSRAKVDVLWIGVNYKNHNKYYKNNNDPFHEWFKSTFNLDNINENSQEDYQEELKEKNIREKLDLVKGRSLVDTLVELYNLDMEKLLSNYQTIGKLDPTILKEFGINVENLSKGLKEKIKGLKQLYWNELFSNLNTITNRLTHKSRKEMLYTIQEYAQVDFNTNNCYSIIIWVIKNANEYFEKQLVYMYKKFCSKENVRNYVSNKKIVNDGWRFQEESSHYKLDYRIVWNTHSTFSTSHWEQNVNGLTESASNLLNDICTIAKNLHFKPKNTVYHFQWMPGKKNTFLYENNEIFMECRAYKNGNIHIKFDQQFMKAFNVEASRILKWIKTPQEAAYEMEITPQEAQKYFEQNLKLITNHKTLLIE